MRVTKRWLALLIGVALSVGACTGSSTVTTSTFGPVTTTDVPASTTTTVDQALARELPTDEAVVMDVLGNGFTYYLRENDSPGGRVELRLLVDAGSIHEGPDQQGMAHFLEHMMFNGTQRFPENDLIAVLESFGPRFGPDINAYTSYDETVYELSLKTDDDLMELGVEVLREWATEATLTRPDVVAERGVVLDEWRLRAQGYGARVTEQLSDLILAGSRYEDHSPIGTDDSISAASPETLQEFYEAWYRPDRMALVAVGDFDVDEMKDLVMSLFEDIPEASEEVEFESVEFEPPSEPRVSTFTDEEAAVAGVTVLYPVERMAVSTVGDYQRAVTATLGLQILGDRINDDALAADSPLLEGTPIDIGWTRAVGIRGVDVEVRSTRAEEGLTRVLTEIERIRREGVSDDEFQRVVDAFSAASRQRFDQRASAQDAQFATQISAHHLEGAHLMSPEQLFEIESEIAERLTTSQVNATLAEVLGGAPAVLALGPDDEGLSIPDPSRILELMDDVGSGPLVDRDDSIESGELMPAPDPVDPSSVSVDPRFDYTTLEFDNGATVYLWESDIAASSVYALVEGFGGTSLVSVPDLPEAFLMADIAARSGVGDLDATELRRVLSDDVVEVGPFFSETRQGLEGSASSEDVETLLQLIHLIMTHPRLDESAADAVLDELATLNASRDDLPSILFDEALNDAYYGDDPRYFALPTSEQLADFDLDRARDLFRSLLSNASDFAFAFVGDFDVAEMTELASRYIGTLPGGGDTSGFVDNQPLPPREVQVATVAAGSGEQGQVGLFFTNEFEPVLADRLTARLLELILSARLRQRVREELSATYSIVAGVELQRDPDPFAEAFVISTGDPDGLEVIVSEIVADLAALQAEGPTGSEFDTAVAQMSDELELLDNLTIANGLVTAHLYPDQPFLELAQRRATLETITPADVQEMASVAFDLDQRIEIRQVPGD